MCTGRWKFGSSETFWREAKAAKMMFNEEFSVRSHSVTQTY